MKNLPLLDLTDPRTKTLPGFPAAWSGTGPDDSEYRYVLWWLTGHGDPRNFMTAIGCNPSTATVDKTDPTVTRWIHWARSWGFGAVAVLNRKAYRTSQPAALKRATDPAGPENMHWLLTIGRNAKFALACWGNIGVDDDKAFQAAWDAAGCPPLHCLSTTAGGAPAHPLARGRNRIPDDITPRLWHAPNIGGPL